MNYRSGIKVELEPSSLCGCSLVGLLGSGLSSSGRLESDCQRFRLSIHAGPGAEADGPSLGEGEGRADGRQGHGDDGSGWDKFHSD